jgi:hypothetical protein
MNYHCSLCNNDIQLETGSYSFVRSEILLHLDRCDVSRRLTPNQRSSEATAAADAKFMTIRVTTGSDADDTSRRYDWR